MTEPDDNDIDDKGTTNWYSDEHCPICGALMVESSHTVSCPAVRPSHYSRSTRVRVNKRGYRLRGYRLLNKVEKWD